MNASSKMLLLATLLFFAPAVARADTPGTVFTPSFLGINGTQLSTNPSFTISTSGFSSLTVYTNLTYVAASAVTLNCVAGHSTISQAPIGVATVNSTGQITMADASWSYPTGSKSRLFRIVVAPIADGSITCTIGGTGATTDTVKVGAYGVH